MKKALSVFIIILLNAVYFSVNAQNIKGANLIFLTEQDFINDKGIGFESVKNYMFSGNNQTVYFIIDGKRIGYNMKKIFGFRFKDSIFRYCTNGGDAVCLIITGKIFYWENGAAHLTMRIHDSNEGWISGGNSSYVSRKINDVIYPITGRASTEFQKLNPELKDFFDCIYKKYSYVQFRECVEIYNKVVE